MSKKAKLLEYLKINRKATFLEIGNLVNTISSGSMVADLRKIGCTISSKFLYMSKSGGRVWEYELLSWVVDLPKGGRVWI